MAPPNLQWRDSSDVLLPTAAHVLADEVGGTPGTAVVRHLWNNFGGTGADTAETIELHSLARDAGSPAALFAEGNEFVDRHYFEYRVMSGLGGLVVAQGSWRKLGANILGPLPDISNDQGIKLEIRVNAPGDAPDLHSLPQIQVRSQLSVAGAGSLPSAILIGPGAIDQILTSAGAAVENPAAADDKVQLQSTIYQTSEVPFAEVQQLFTLDGNDGAAAALIAGEAYYARLVWTSAGPAARKGLKNTTPLSTSDEPALLPGDVEDCLVERQFDAIINDAEITDRRQIGGFGYISATGLTATFGGGSAHVQRYSIRKRNSSPVTLTASVENRVWLQTDGTFAVTSTDTPPTEGAMLIRRLTTDATTVTADQDERTYKGREVVPIMFRFIGALSAQVQDAHWPYNSTGRLLGIGSMTASVPTAWGGTGSIIFDLKKSDAGGAFTSFFPSAPTLEQRPEIAAAGVSDNGAIPEGLVVPPLARLQASIPGVPTGGTDPLDATLIVLVEL